MICSASPSRIFPLYLEADFSLYHPVAVQRPVCLQDKFIVLYFGSVLPLQGVEIVLKAMSSLKENKDLFFYFIGPVKGRRLQGLCPLADNIEYIRWLTQEQLAEIGSDFTGYLGGLVQAIGEPTFAAAGNFAKNVPATLIAIIMSILSAYFFTAERDAILAEVKKNVPASVWDRVSGVIYDLKRVVGGYFKAQFKIMGVVYVLLVIGLFILHMDYVLLVAFLIAFLDMLPFFGTGTVLWPWAAIKILSGDYRIAVGLIILYAVTQIVRQVIQPKIVGDTIGMNPLATLIFMYIGYKVSSIGGMIVAVPVGMILINLYQSGVFDNQIRCIRELVNDINEFRKF